MSETLNDKHDVLINKMYLPTHIQESLKYEEKVIKLFQKPEGEY